MGGHVRDEPGFEVAFVGMFRAESGPRQVRRPHEGHTTIHDQRLGVNARAEDTLEELRLDEVGLLVNSSRAIIYAGQGEDFAEASREAAKAVQAEMEVLLKDAGII